MSERNRLIEKCLELESEKKELLELLKSVLISYRETVQGEWNYDIFKAGYNPECESALQVLKNNGIEIK